MLNVSKITIGINKRFFEAIDILVANKSIRGLKTFTDKYELNRTHIMHVKINIEKTSIKAECLTCLVDGFGISAYWLLTGRGKMFGGVSDVKRKSLL